MHHTLHFERTERGSRAPLPGGSSFGYHLYGTCGLSGLVVGRTDAAALAVAPGEPSGKAPAPAAKGASFDTTFEGLVSTEIAGDYVVAFRASANGGETLDIVRHGRHRERLLDRQGVRALPERRPGGAHQPDHARHACHAEQRDAVRPARHRGRASHRRDRLGQRLVRSLPDFTPTKKKSDSSGCSMTSRSALLTSSLPLIGVVVALAAILQRRKKLTADN